MSYVLLTSFNYYVTLIDDFSHNTWIYFLKRKKSKESLQKLQGFKALVKNQTRRRIQVLHLDNGGEYTSIAFNEFCS